ncbi:MAG: peptidoglycan-binding domain-containing protein [Pyrinomonadaceae bacterium]
MNFVFSENNLRRLCQINSFEFPDDGLVFFGLRGCTVVNETQSVQFADSHQLDTVDLNYKRPRCVIGQWKPAEGKIACFIGSTVPSISYIQHALAAQGVGANQLMTGRYDDYVKGIHKYGRPTGHRAFRQTKARAIRRTMDDLDYENNDRVEVMNPFDNIHAGWCSGFDAGYDSAGCQVLMGHPKCAARGAADETGHWKIFRRNAYSLEQNQFVYILLTGNDAMRQSLAGEAKRSARLRYGSEGELVKTMQQALQDREILESNPDGNFGQRTLMALLSFQEQTFGTNADDGVAGPMTAEALGIEWPEV